MADERHRPDMVKVLPTNLRVNRELERMIREAPKLKCSFCLKSQDAVRSIISTPTDDPRAYICDECVAVCSACMNPLLSEFLSAAEIWISEAPDSEEAKDQLSRMRSTAREMFGSKSGT